MTILNETTHTHVALSHGPDAKTFLKEQLQLTGMEVSWTELAPGESSSFLHSHQQNEELYICNQGHGQMQVDGQTFDFSKGSFVRVSPEGKRAVRNVGSEPLQYICIQAREGSLAQWTREDGVLHQDQLSWPISS